MSEHVHLKGAIVEAKILFFNVGLFVRGESFVCAGILPVAKEVGDCFTLLELIELGRLSGFEPFPENNNMGGVVEVIEKETRTFVQDIPGIENMSLVRAHPSGTHVREYIFDYDGGCWPMRFSPCDIPHACDGKQGFVFVQTLPNTQS